MAHLLKIATTSCQELGAEWIALTRDREAPRSYPGGGAG